MRRKSKGQFMIISSVVVGIIVISVAGTISEVQSRHFNNPDTAYQLDSIRDEASMIDTSDQKERENFQKLVNFLEPATETVYWSRAGEECFNVTLQDTGYRTRLDCVS